MKPSNRWLAVGLCLAVTLILTLGTNQARAEDETNEELAQAEKRASEEVRVHFQLPPMFNFDRFKSAFDKHYQSAIEELVRMKLFLARAYSAFVTAIKYKYRQSKHYLAVNPRSDWTQEEIEQTFMRESFTIPDGVKVRDITESSSSGEEADGEAERVEYLAEPAAVKAELDRIQAHASEPGYEQVAAELRNQRASARRRRRDAGLLEPRSNFDMMNDVFGRANNRLAKNDFGDLVGSNNPDYEQPDVASEMSLDELKQRPDYSPLYYRDIYMGRRARSYDHLPVKSAYKTKKNFLVAMTTSLVSGLSNLINSQDSSKSNSGIATVDTSGLPDEVWVDHRKSGCLMPVQQQGRCGSCYAFGATTMFEFVHCKETGERVKFSEQYILDCGRRMDGLNGCNGGMLTDVGFFAQNYGLELARHYPYKARAEQCPYDDKTPLRSMGYMRVDMFEITRIPIPFFEEHLPNVPMVINISPLGDFQWYGGGVLDGKSCKPSGTHTVVLIGHGREDGEEYWLIRNSYSANYGEQGHVKLNKNSNCIHPPVGFVFGSLHTDGSVSMYATRNSRVPEPIKLAGNKRKPEESTTRKPVSELFLRELEAARKREEAQRKRVRVNLSP